MKTETFCEDCGASMKTNYGSGLYRQTLRRTRCRRCGLLVCDWCYKHVHAIQLAGFDPPACASTKGVA